MFQCRSIFYRQSAAELRLLRYFDSRLLLTFSEGQAEDVEPWNQAFSICKQCRISIHRVARFIRVFFIVIWESAA